MEAGWSTITSTVPNFAASLANTARSFGSLLGRGLSKTFLPAGVSPWPWWVLLPTSRPRKTPTSPISYNPSSRAGLSDAALAVGVDKLVCADPARGLAVFDGAMDVQHREETLAGL